MFSLAIHVCKESTAKYKQVWTDLCTVHPSSTYSVTRTFMETLSLSLEGPVTLTHTP